MWYPVMYISGQHGGIVSEAHGRSNIALRVR
jgi:hypothetical protein